MRTVAMGLVALLGGCGGGSADVAAPAAVVEVEAEAETVAVLPGGEPLLRMPFEAGTAVLCQQGNRTGRERTHGWPNALHALDLTAPGDEARVVAAADGTVRRVVTGAAAGAAQPGGGFGNAVVLEHAGGYQTLYAHLDQVAVKTGETVSAGQPLGTMGDTGRAGNRHLHFSLHRAESWPDDGAPDTVVMHGLVTVDLTAGGELSPMTGLELQCADSAVSPKGHLYGSENEPGRRARFGAVPPELGERFAVQAKALERMIGEANRVDAVMARLKDLGPEATRAALEDHVTGHADDAVALYWIAVLSLRDLGDWARAEEAVGRLVTLAPTSPPWLVPWLLVRRAEVAEHRGELEAAKALWGEVGDMAKDDAELRQVLGAAQKRLGK